MVVALLLHLLIPISAFLLYIPSMESDPRQPYKYVLVYSLTRPTSLFVIIRERP